MWCHAVFCIENFMEIKIYARQDIINMQVYMTRVILHDLRFSHERIPISIPISIPIQSMRMITYHSL